MQTEGIGLGLFTGVVYYLGSGLLTGNWVAACIPAVAGAAMVAAKFNANLVTPIGTILMIAGALRASGALTALLSIRGGL